MTIATIAAQTLVLRDIDAVHPWLAQWQALAEATGSYFVGPGWLLRWWDAYGATLGGSLAVIALVEQDTLIGLAPLYIRKAKVAPLEAVEVRLLGDAGPRPAGLDFLAAADKRERVGVLLASAIRHELGEWDVVDLAPLADPSLTRAHLLSRLGAAGFAIESSPAAGASHRVALSLLGGDGPGELDQGFAVHIETALDAQLRSISALARLSRLEWAEREETSPLADREAGQLLAAVVTDRAREGAAWSVRIDEPMGEAVAIALFVEDGDRATMIAGAIDPHVSTDLGAILGRHAAFAAAARGRGALDVTAPVSESSLGSLPVVRRTPLAVRVWNRGAAASLHRTYASVRRGAKAAREAPVAAAAQARAAWSKIREVASHVAGVQHFELMRGQLWTRGISASGVEMRWFDAAQWETLSEAERTDVLVSAGLDEARLVDFFHRGDRAFLAARDGRIAGVAWVSRGEIFMPELGRKVHPSKYDCIVHDVFVVSAFRGQAIAPALLDRLAGELRQLDLYRSWAVVPIDQLAPRRAFSKAGFTPVCAVAVNRSGRISVSPPDPEAKDLLGIGRVRTERPDIAEG